MNTILMVIFTLKVGLFGTIMQTEQYLTFSDMDSCKTSLNQIYDYNKHLEIQRNQTTIKVVDKPNYTIQIFQCRSEG